jgi:hypothetical protein
MKSVLEEAAAPLPEVASVILTQAARGERDWMALKMAALSAVKDCTLLAGQIDGSSEANRAPHRCTS